MRADRDKCIACKRCFPYCPMGRIQTYHRHDKIPGRVYIEIDQDKCTDCGMCLRANICPVKALYQLRVGIGHAYLHYGGNRQRR